MPKTPDALQKHTMNFYEGDFDRIRALWPDEEPSRIIREFVHQLVERHEAVGNVAPPKIEIQVKAP